MLIAILNAPPRKLIVPLNSSSIKLGSLITQNYERGDNIFFIEFSLFEHPPDIYFI